MSGAALVFIDRWLPLALWNGWHVATYDNATGRGWCSTSSPENRHRNATALYAIKDAYLSSLQPLERYNWNADESDGSHIKRFRPIFIRRKWQIIKISFKWLWNRLTRTVTTILDEWSPAARSECESATSWYRDTARIMYRAIMARYLCFRRR